jgi:DNA-binding response OmpR family regulator
MKIVVVEDDQLLAGHYKRTLEKAGYEVHHVAHALGAIDLIDEVRPDAIVLDMLLTGSTGMILLHELQSHDDLGSIPIIMTTNLAQEISSESLEHYGVRRLLDKGTMHPDDLVAAVRAVLL